MKRSDQQGVAQVETSGPTTVLDGKEIAKADRLGLSWPEAGR